MINSNIPNNLDIELVVAPNCELITVDNTDYSQGPEDGVWTDYSVIECFTKKDISETTISLNECIIKPIWHDWDLQRDYFRTQFYIKSDGNYNYYKLIVKREFLNGKVNLNEFWDNEHLVWTVPYYFSIVLFTICHLETCLIKLQKEYIEKYQFKNCKNSEEGISLKNKRDFILDSVFVLKYLIAGNNYIEAQRILNNLTQCRSICENLITDSNDCNCERPI